MTLTKEFLEKELKTKSFYQIAEELGDGYYPNKLRRYAKKNGIAVPNKSEAQRKALQNGRAEHPTEGKEMSQETKNKIGEGIAKAWENMSEDQKQKIADASKKRWDKTPKYKKKEFFDKAAKAIRAAAQNGSKTEHAIVEGLKERGYAVDFHRQRLIANEKLEIDMVIPSHKTVIEINGVSHYEPIHGEEVLRKKIKADNQKYGLLASSGYCVIVVKHVVKAVTDLYHRRLLELIVEKLEEINKKFPAKGKRIIRVEV